MNQNLNEIRKLVKRVTIDLSCLYELKLFFSIGFIMFENLDLMT